MPKNISEQSLKNALTNALNEVRAIAKTNRVNQNYPLNYFPLPQGVSTTIEALASPQNGWIYYATDLNHIRAYVNGAWVTVI